MGQYIKIFPKAKKLAIEGNYRGAQQLIEGIITAENLSLKDRCNANFFMCRLYSNYALGNLDSSLHYLVKATSIAEEMQNDTLMAGCYERLGVLYENRSQMLQSLQYYQKSATLYQKMKNEHGMAIIFSNMGIHHALQGNYAKSNQYLQQAIPIINQLKNQDRKTAYLSSTYNSLGSNALELENYKVALEYYQKGHAFRKQIYPLGHSLVILDEVNIASAYYKQGLMDSAFYHLDLGIEQASENANASLATLYEVYATIFLEQKKYKKASIQAHKALEYYKLVYDSPHQINRAKVYNILSKIATEQHQYLEGLEYVQEALIANSHNFTDSFNLTNNPKISEVLALDIELVSLTQKGIIYYQWYKKTQDHEYLREGWKHLKVATELIDSIRLEYYNDYPLLMLRKEAQNTFQWALSCLYELEQLTPKKFLTRIFAVLEQSKSYAFLATTQQQSNLQDSKNLPLVWSQWRGNAENTAFYKSQLLEEKRLNKSAAQIKETKQKLFKLGQEQEELLRQIKKELPTYYKQYFQVNYQTLETLQTSLKPREAMLIYGSGVQNLFALKVTPNELLFEKLARKEIIVQQVQNFRTSILKKVDKVYLTEAYSLYQQLIEPLKLASDVQEISLVPDATLHYVAFDALLTKAVAGATFPNYQDLPYLIKKYNFSYQYSATIALDYQKRKLKKKTQLAAFAPEFFAPTEVAQLAERNNPLINLPGSKVEIDAISTFFSATNFVGTKATKANFLDQIRYANLIHLATHGLLNSEQPAYSAIAFSGDSGTVDLLYAHELYGKKIQVDLLTLSACNSGLGKFHVGEGMMSLARNFSLAGCPSVVMSFWEIADQSAPFIFPKFYNYLAQGMSKNLALQQAKLDYLKQSDANGAHPYYWAGIALIGNTAAVTASATFNWFNIGVGVFLICLVVIIVYFRKKV